MLESEYQLLKAMKETCNGAGFSAKKGQLLRAGVALLGALDLDELKGALAILPPFRVKHPKKKPAEPHWSVEA